ncbi:MAG: hypothetical protein R2777_05160 [Chitinophagales bacterium]
MLTFFQSMVNVLNNEKTSLKDKAEIFAAQYIDLISKNPEIPTFIVSEIRNNPKILMDKISLKNILLNSVFIQQFKEAVKKEEIKEHNPLHFILNMLSLVVFPFIAKPMIMYGAGLSETNFEQLMEERKKMIPIWMEFMFKK